MKIIRKQILERPIQSIYLRKYDIIEARVMNYIKIIVLRKVSHTMGLPNATWYTGTGCWMRTVL